MAYGLPSPGDPAESGWAGKLNASIDAVKTTSDALASRVAGVSAATGTPATDTANIAAAIASLPTAPLAGGTVMFPPGQWVINAPLSLLTGLHFKGAGKGASEIQVQSGNMFAPTATKHHVTFEDLTLSTASGHLFDFGATGGLAESRFKSCVLIAYATAASLMHMDGTGDFAEVVFDGCEFVRQSGATVPAFDLKTSGAGISASVWDSCRAAGNNCTAVPFWRIEATLGAYVHDLNFRNIVGEQNRGGLIHLYSPTGARFENVLDWDATGNYTDHIVKVATSATSGGKLPRDIGASNVGTRYGTLSAGVHHFDCPTQPDTPVMLDRIGDTTGRGVIPYIWGQSVRDAWGASGSVCFVPNSYAIDWDCDGIVVGTGAGITISLPNPSGYPYLGRKFTIKNTNASALTVNSAGGAVIDGAASKSLAQWAVITVTTDGAGWFTV
jgi:hypothetical protein